MATTDASRKEFVEELRRVKFSIGALQRNPLAEDYNEAIKQLSVALYQKDIHFISELIQNAEDNAYPPGSRPTLELVLTKTDVTGVGASATLCLFNNEVGFAESNIKAICGVGASTKKGKRKSGYIGEKGIGFKSVFIVTQTPHIISNGYRIRFDERPHPEAGVGYVVPEWTRHPMDADLHNVYHGGVSLPSTVLVLPLKDMKVQAVQTQLQQISPETILFIKHLSKISIRNEFDATRGQDQFSITREDGRTWVSHGLPMLTVTAKLSVQKGSKVVHSSNYFLYQESFPVEKQHVVESRREVDSWMVTLAFPCPQRIVVEGLAQSGDVFAFLPTELRSNLPFLINSDFLLVASRETMLFDNPWNQGILGCIPKAFLRAFDVLLQKRTLDREAIAPLEVADAYSFVPVQASPVPALETVRLSIIKELCNGEFVLCSQDVGSSGRGLFCRPSAARMINKKFRSILERSNDECVPPPGLLSHSGALFIVNESVQEKYASAMKIMNVVHMSDQEYASCISSPGWLGRLSTSLYLDVLGYVADHLGSCTSSAGALYRIPLLRCEQNAEDAFQLTSLEEQNMTRTGTQRKIFRSAPQVEEWLCNWTSCFSLWTEVYFLSTDVVHALRDGRYPNIDRWLSSTAQLTELTVSQFAKQLIASAKGNRSPRLVLLLTGFLYRCLEAGQLTALGVIGCSEGQLPAVDRHGLVRLVSSQSVVAQPHQGSKWSDLVVDDSWSSHMTVLSDDYLKPEMMNLANVSSSSMKQFLGSLLHATDLPQLPIADIPLPAVSKTLVEKKSALLLFEWIATIPKLPLAFLSSIQSCPWMQTAHHGRRQPTSCIFYDKQDTLLLTSDVPMVSYAGYGNELSGFRKALQAIGVALEGSEKATMVARYLLELSNSSAANINLGVATRLYTCLHKLKWHPGRNDALKTVWVPPGSWMTVKSCTITDPSSLFEEHVPVLDEVYTDTELLTFFQTVLHVPKVPTVEHHCDLWLRNSETCGKITRRFVEVVWRAITDGWDRCESGVRETFLQYAPVPFVYAGEMAGYELELAPAGETFLPDSLELVHAFSRSANGRPKVVWIPRSSTTLSRDNLYQVYSRMGVRSLRDSVIPEIPSRPTASSVPSTVARGQGLVTKSLLSAVLAFLSHPEHKLNASRRHQMLQSLVEVTEYEMNSPYPLKHLLQGGTGNPYIVFQDQMVHWEGSTGSVKFSYLGQKKVKNLGMPDQLIFASQLVKALAYGVAGECPHVAQELQEFLLILYHSGRFHQDAVDYWLRQRNMPVLQEDEVFLLSVSKRL